MVFGRDEGQACAYLGPGPMDVGQAPVDRTPLGVYDLGGNVQEWVMDRFEEHYRPCSAPCVDPLVDDTPQPGVPDPGGPVLRVLRGASWTQRAAVCRSAGRSRWQQGRGLINGGFRCAWPASPAPSTPR